MTPSVYIIGGAGAGKSTFTSHLLTQLGCHFMGPLIDLYSKRNAKSLVTLRGHRTEAEWDATGLYLGVMRNEFPGSDGLDRASSPTGVAWLESGGAGDFDFILGEGATLATRPFLTSLAEHTNMLLVHLYVDPVIADLRFLQRGSNQDPKFVLNTVTRSENLLRDMTKLGVDCGTVDTADLKHWRSAIDACKEHLQKG